VTEPNVKRTAVVAIAVLAVFGGGSSCRPKVKVSSLDKKEFVILPVGMQGGVCSLLQKQPGDLRTEGDSHVTWVVVGSCDAKGGNPITIEIKRKLVKNGGEYDAFVDGGTKLSGSIPTSDGPAVYLRGKLKPRANIEKGRYKYTVLIDGAEAQFQSRADDGDFFLCPVWPCDYD
jgi:hypothetical protein